MRTITSIAAATALAACMLLSGRAQALDAFTGLATSTNGGDGSWHVAVSPVNPNQTSWNVSVWDNTSTGSLTAVDILFQVQGDINGAPASSGVATSFVSPTTSFFQGAEGKNDPNTAFSGTYSVLYVLPDITGGNTGLFFNGPATLTGDVSKVTGISVTLVGDKLVTPDNPANGNVTWKYPVTGQTLKMGGSSVAPEASTVMLLLGGLAPLGLLRKYKRRA